MVYALCRNLAGSLQRLLIDGLRCARFLAHLSDARVLLRSSDPSAVLEDVIAACPLLQELSMEGVSQLAFVRFALVRA